MSAREDEKLTETVQTWVGESIKLKLLAEAEREKRSLCFVVRRILEKEAKALNPRSSPEAYG